MINKYKVKLVALNLRLPLHKEGIIFARNRKELFQTIKDHSYGEIKWRITEIKKL